MRRQRSSRSTVRHSGRRRVLRRRVVLSPLAVAGVLVPLIGGAALQGAGEAAVLALDDAPASVTLPIPPEPPAPPQAPAQAARVRVQAAARLLPSAVPWQLWQAYARAAAWAPPDCHLPISLLEAIGQVESGSLAGRSLDSGNRVVPAVLGPVLDGHGFAAISDTDDGALDGDTTWDRAVGPMQFIPSTWARWGRDADGDGTADPQDIDDAAAGASTYLCAGGRDLATPEGVRAAVLSYNHSTGYLAVVLRWKARFDLAAPGVVSLPPAAPLPPQRPAVQAAATVQVAEPVALAAPPPASAAATSQPAQPVAEDPAPAAVEEPPPVAEVPPPDPTAQPTPQPTPEPAPEPCPSPAPTAPVDPADPATPATPATPADPGTASATPADPGTAPASPADPADPADPCAPADEAAPDGTASAEQPAEVAPSELATPAS